MIVASHQKGWKIINQRSHGLLAAMLAYQYDIDLPNDIMVPTLIAIAEQLKFKSIQEFNKICRKTIVQREEFVL